MTLDSPNGINMCIPLDELKLVLVWQSAYSKIGFN